MASNYSYLGTDFDSLFCERGTYTAVPDTGFKVAGTDISNRFAPHADILFADYIGTVPVNDRLTYNIGYVTGAIDLSQTFRDRNAPNVTLVGPSSVAAGSFNGEIWAIVAGSSTAFTGTRFQIAGHGLGGWFDEGSTNYVSGTVTWADPFGNPSISNTPGTYNFYWEAMNENQLVGHVDMTVTVT